MSLPYVVAIEGLDALAEFAESGKRIDSRARMALNGVIDWARTQSSKEIRRQVNFPANYLDSKQDGRLQVTTRATDSNLEAVITARHRATSLARFTETRDPGVSRRQGGVKVEVKPGSAKFMERAFLMRLRAGATLTDTKYNLGLAIRLRPGERLQNKTHAQQVASNLYVLYGPSVDQVFRHVSEELRHPIEDRLEAEFTRLMKVEFK